jgi:hypothetical protein
LDLVVVEVADVDPPVLSGSHLGSILWISFGRNLRIKLGKSNVLIYTNYTSLIFSETLKPKIMSISARVTRFGKLRPVEWLLTWQVFWKIQK